MAIVAVSCSDPYISQEIILVSATFNEISSLMTILTFYVFIFIAEDAFNWGAPQSLLHLCLPPEHCHHFPWDCPVPLLCTQLQKLMASGQSSHCVFYWHDSYA